MKAKKVLKTIRDIIDWNTKQVMRILGSKSENRKTKMNVRMIEFVSVKHQLGTIILET